MKTNKGHIENGFPTLEKLKGKNGLNTPESYFDLFHDSIMNQISGTKKTPILSFYKVFGYTASVSIIAGICSIFFFCRR